LISPFSKIKNFEILLKLPKEFKNLEGPIESPEALNKPNYLVNGKFDGKNTVIFEYSSKLNKEKENVKRKIVFTDEREAKCGTFEYELRVWNRESESLKELATDLGSTLKDVRSQLNELAGISIYRDGFRVLPYGESDADWLGLDLRRINNPTLRLSNSQIIGYIGISLEKNPMLKDQSNREGIIESIAFDDLKDVMKSVLSEIETRRYKERPREEKRFTDVGGIFSKFTIDPVKELIEKRLPEDLELKKVVLKTEATLQEGIKQAQEVISRYRRLSTLGLLLDTVLHDGNNILLRIDDEANLINEELKGSKSGIEKIKSRLDIIINERETLSKLFRRLEPFSGRKRSKPTKIILENSLKNVFDLFERNLEKAKVRIKLPIGNTQIKFDESDFEIIFVNLLDNSLYWLTLGRDKDREIVVDVSKDVDKLYITFSDNGPGVDEEDADRIFDPYFSKKPDGIGLGLTIAGEMVTEYGGELALVRNGPLEGATFRITFNNEIYGA
jgi:hypothetical protein